MSKLSSLRASFSGQELSCIGYLIQPPIVFDFRDKYLLYQFLAFCRKQTGGQPGAGCFGDPGKLALHRFFGTTFACDRPRISASFFRGSQLSVSNNCLSWKYVSSSTQASRRQRSESLRPFLSRAQAQVFAARYWSLQAQKLGGGKKN